MPRSVVYRVQGLPRGCTEAQLRATLQTCLSDEENAGSHPKISIIPSCYDHGKTCIALLTLDAAPRFLSALDVNPLTEWSIETDYGDISFDRHFHGFTQLYSTPLDKPITAESRWTCLWVVEGQRPLQRMWLRDFLGKDLPHCRTLIYGYNAKLHIRGINTLSDYCAEFIEELKLVRASLEESRRPLILLGHSFGGLITAQTLIKAKHYDRDANATLAHLYDSIIGLMFFATPHRGLLIDDIQAMVGQDGSNPRSTLVDRLQYNSQSLVDQLCDFRNLIHERIIVNFIEMQQTRRLVANEDGTWSRSGDLVTALSPESALLQLPDSMEIKVRVDADHSSIVKLNTMQTPTYQRAIKYLRQCEEVAIGRSSRFSTSKPASGDPFLSTKDSSPAALSFKLAEYPAAWLSETIPGVASTSIYKKLELNQSGDKIPTHTLSDTKVYPQSNAYEIGRGTRPGNHINGKHPQMNVESRLVALESSQETINAQYEGLLAALQNSTLSTIRLGEFSTLKNEYILDIEVSKSTIAKYWSVKSFDDLGLPNGHGMMIQSLVKQYERDWIRSREGRQDIYDIVKGKGKGLIFLLHGQRGQDLSITAEAMAKFAQRPLHRISCTKLAHLGPLEFERELCTQLTASSQERAVVLIDEADMLLSSKTKHDFSRNGLVAVTLRVIENYDGILIFTTTRVGDFDEAYSSRIHISLYYPQMDRASAMNVWKSELRHVKTEGGLDFNESDLLSFAKRCYPRFQKWNAKQIHDIVHSAKELAVHDHVEHLRAKKKRIPWSEPDQPVMTPTHLKRAAKACEYLMEEDDADKDTEELHAEGPGMEYPDTTASYQAELERRMIPALGDEFPQQYSGGFHSPWDSGVEQPHRPHPITNPLGSPYNYPPIFQSGNTPYTSFLPPQPNQIWPPAMPQFVSMAGAGTFSHPGSTYGQLFPTASPMPDELPPQLSQSHSRSDTSPCDTG